MRRTVAVTAAFTGALSTILAGAVVGLVPATSARAADDGSSAPPAQVRRAPADYGNLRNILPPGSNGNVTATDLLALGGSTTATPTTPAHFADQLEMYDALTKKNPNTLTSNDLNRLYKGEGFTPEKVLSTSRPAPGVTIRRDAYGVPFVNGKTFANVEFGAGYAAIEDRMFLMDVLRHTGQGRITEFVGDTPSNVAMDQSQLRSAFYTEDEAAAQIRIAAKDAGTSGKRLTTAVDSFVAGINKAQSDLCPVLVALTCPVEYTALQKVPTDWTRADVVYIASLVGGIFGKGGGNEVANATWLQALTKKFGAREGRRVYNDLREKNDPEAPTTSNIRTPYEGGPINPDKPGVALPDQNGKTAPGTGAMLGGQAPAGRAVPGQIDLPDGGHISIPLERHAMSNAILVSGKQSKTGKPLVVFGPQTGYYTPQLLVEQVLDGPGIKARGVAFAGTNLFVQLGRGLDYAWSATSAGSDLVDTVVEKLCNTDGGKATVDSTGYLVGSTCRPMKTNTHTENTVPNATSPGLPKTYRFLVLRTRHGIVQTRTTVKGRPVAIVSQRSTYGHEVDSVLGFAQFNDPGYVHDAKSFQKAASHIDFTFNWFYADNKDISYFSSGLLPVRSKKVDSDLPHWAGKAYDWKGWLSNRRHVQQTNPPSGYFVSWNNKPAPGFGAADDTYSYGPVYRSLALESRLRAKTEGSRKVDIEDIVGVMADAATADSRAAYTLPWLLKAVGNDRATVRARALLRTWLRHGAHRLDRDRDGAYSDQAAIAIFDDWWQHGRRNSVARDVLRGRLGSLVNQLPQKIDDHPRQGIGSSFNGVAWYGYVNKDLRRTFGAKVAAPYHVGYCGRGNRAACRRSLTRSLKVALARTMKTQGVTDPRKLTYDKTQDDIRSVTAGVVGVRPIDWQNRPTFQQVVEFTRHRPR